MSNYNLDESKGIKKVLSEKNIMKILKSYDTLQFKHYNLNDTINAVVIAISGNNITIQPKCYPNESFFFPNDPVVLNLTYSDEYYSISGEIISVNSITPSELIVRIISINNKKNIRSTSRFYVSLVSQLKASSQSEYEFGISKNISLNGVKINCKEDLLIGETVFVTVNLEISRKYAFKGKIVRKTVLSNFFEYGIEIIEITKSNQATLFHYVNQLGTL